MSIIVYPVSVGESYVQRFPWLEITIFNQQSSSPNHEWQTSQADNIRNGTTFQWNPSSNHIHLPEFGKVPKCGQWIAHYLTSSLFNLEVNICQSLPKWHATWPCIDYMTRHSKNKWFFIIIYMERDNGDNHGNAWEGNVLFGRRWSVSSLSWCADRNMYSKQSVWRK